MKWTKEAKLTAAVAVALVALLAASMLLSLPVSPSFQGFNEIPLTLQLAGGSGYIIIAVAQGQGQVCAQDLTLQQTAPTCTSTSYNFPTQVGDQVSFSATPAAGYSFEYLQACGSGTPSSGCVQPTSQNPTTATIVQQSNGGNGGVFAYFTSGAGQGSTIIPISGFPVLAILLGFLLGLVLLVLQRRGKSSE